MKIDFDEILSNERVAAFLGKDVSEITSDDKFGVALFGLSVYLDKYEENLPKTLTLEEMVKAGVYALIVENGYFDTWSFAGYDCSPEEVEAILKDLGFALDIYVYDDEDGICMTLGYVEDEEWDEETQEFWKVGYNNAKSMTDGRLLFDAASKIIFGQWLWGGFILPQQFIFEKDW